MWRFVLVVVVACGDNSGADVTVDAAPDTPRDADPCATLQCDDGDACTADSCAAGTCHNVQRSTCGEQPACDGACPFADVDGDGLDDVSEARGFVDSNCNGLDDGPAVDLRLPGANVGRKTIYLEYDYMAKPGSGTACTTDAGCSSIEACENSTCQHSHRPRATALDMVVAAFAAKNIDLVIDAAPTRLVETDVVTFGTTAATCAGPSAASFHALKTASFDPRKRWISRYAVFGHYATCNSGANCVLCPEDPLTQQIPPFGVSGTAEIRGNDFIVTMARRWQDFALPRQIDEAGTIMHELGHNLGLRHGGHESFPEGKPNYLSVMNRAFQFSGIATAGGGVRVDYSNAVLPTLDESALVESAGIGAGTNDITHFTNGMGIDADGAGTGPIDWDGDGAIAATTLAAPVDINSDGVFTTLTGSNDWAILVVPFACEPSGTSN